MMWQATFIYGKWRARKATYEARRCTAWVEAQSAKEVRSVLDKAYVIVSYEQITRHPGVTFVPVLDEPHAA